MENNKSTYFKIYSAILSFFTDSSDIKKGELKHTKNTSKIEEYLQNTKEQNNSSTKLDRLEDTERQLKELISFQTEVFKDTLKLYALKNNITKLIEHADKSRADFKQLKNDKFSDKVKDTLELLERYATKLEPYGVSIDDIQELRTNYTEYTNIYIKIRNHTVKVAQLSKVSNLHKNTLTVTVE